MHNENAAGSGASTLVDIRWFKAGSHDSENEILSLPPKSKVRAIAVLNRLAQLSKAQFRIKPTYVPDVFEAKLVTDDGGLRLLFVYGRDRILWCIGGYVKKSNQDGNKLLKSYKAVAQLAKQAGAGA